ncbi:hypothetical protein KBB06_03365 [Candidatus Gracilibacteria bacterium]|nr:hypothetical protein [Candidatus Gracilibacteria bacterium]
MKKTFFALTLSSLVALSACQNSPSTPNGQTLEQNTPPPTQQQTTMRFEDLTPSRPAASGCNWVESKAGEKFGIRMMMEKCPDTKIDESKMVIAYDGNMKQFPDPLPWMVAFKKSTGQTPEQALKEQIINQMASADDRNNCVVKKHESSNPNIEVYTIEPAPDYLAKLQSSEAVMEMCGMYGLTNGVQNFVFQKQNQSMFVFELIGQDYPQFESVYFNPLTNGDKPATPKRPGISG